MYYVLKEPSSFLVLIIVTNIYQGFFGFDRSAYSNVKNGRRRKKWYEELREQRTRDIETEML
jgi:hypothetical protein